MVSLEKQIEKRNNYFVDKKRLLEEVQHILGGAVHRKIYITNKDIEFSNHPDLGRIDDSKYGLEVTIPEFEHELPYSRIVITTNPEAGAYIDFRIFENLEKLIKDHIDYMYLNSRTDTMLTIDINNLISRLFDIYGSRLNCTDVAYVFYGESGLNQQHVIAQELAGLITYLETKRANEILDTIVKKYGYKEY